MLNKPIYDVALTVLVLYINMACSFASACDHSHCPFQPNIDLRTRQHLGWSVFSCRDCRQENPDQTGRIETYQGSSGQDSADQRGTQGHKILHIIHFFIVMKKLHFFTIWISQYTQYKFTLWDHKRSHFICSFKMTKCHILFTKYNYFKFSVWFYICYAPPIQTCSLSRSIIVRKWKC